MLSGGFTPAHITPSVKGLLLHDLILVLSEHAQVEGFKRPTPSSEYLKEPWWQGASAPEPLTITAT